MKKTLISLLIGAGIGVAAPAMASSTIQFDPNGTAGASAISVDLFDWLPDNALAIGALGEIGGSSPPGTINTRAQGRLGVFVGPGGPFLPTAGTEFTFVVDLTETQVGVGTGTAAFVPTGGTLTICYDPTADANQLAGTGYGCTGDAQTILTGSIVGGTGAFTDFTRLAPGVFPPVPLDQFGTNNYPGILTHQGNGSTTIRVDVGFADSNFFLTDITTLTVDLQDTTNLAVPFQQANPAALVGGVAPSYSNVGGTLINGGDCPQVAGVNTQRCDFHFQTDASTSFNVPEPASVALLGLGLLALGWQRRRSH